MRLPHQWNDDLRTGVMAALVALVATAARPMIASAQDTGGGQAGGGQAGGGQAGGGRGGRMMAALFDGITLTDAERKSVDSIRTVYQSQMQQARSSGDRSANAGSDAEAERQLRNVLTSDQQTAFDKNLATMRSRMQGMRGGGGAGGGTPPSGTNPQ